MKLAPSISMHCDSQSAIAVAKNKTFNGKNKHIQLRHNVVKQLLKCEVKRKLSRSFDKTPRGGI